MSVWVLRTKPLTSKCILRLEVRTGQFRVARIPGLGTCRKAIGSWTCHHKDCPFQGRTVRRAVVSLRGDLRGDSALTVVWYPSAWPWCFHDPCRHPSRTNSLEA